jgi:hypothetical protein
LEKWLVLMRILAWKLSSNNMADICSSCYTVNPTQHMIHMDQMILSEPSIIIIWTYQDMMGWMSRTLAGEMAGADEDFGLEVWQQIGRLIFVQAATANPTQHMIHIDQMILSEPSIIIIWTYQDMMGWMSRTLVGEMAGADEDFGLEVEQQ